MFWILGLICLLLGFISGLIEEKILFAPLEWFVAAIGFNTLGSPAWPPSFRREG